MAMSAAERQRKYRERSRNQKELARVSIWLNTNARHALKCLSRHYGLSQAELISDLLLKTEKGILDKIIADDEAWARYWNIDINVTETNDQKVNV